MRVVVTGGLTGGHVFPCVTLGLALDRLGHQVWYVGAAGQLEEAMAARYRLRFVGFAFSRAPAWRRRISLVCASARVLPVLMRLRPDVVFCKGSVTGVPAALAACALRVPVVLHESDTVFGSETRRLARLSRRVCVGYATAAHFVDRRVVVTGNLTRPNFTGGRRSRCLRRYGLPEDRPLIAVVGGSQGAARLNAVVREIVPDLVRSYSVIHICGAGKALPTPRMPYYVPLEFVHDDLRDIYAASALVVSRAGAGAVEEACNYEVPALYVPYPWAEERHQERNAEVMVGLGVAEMVLQPDLTSGLLLETIQRMVRDRAVYGARFATLERPTALPLVCEVVLGVADPAGASRGGAR